MLSCPGKFASRSCAKDLWWLTQPFRAPEMLRVGKKLVPHDSRPMCHLSLLEFLPYKRRSISSNGSMGSGSPLAIAWAFS